MSGRLPTLITLLAGVVIGIVFGLALDRRDASPLPVLFPGPVLLPGQGRPRAVLGGEIAGAETRSDSAVRTDAPLVGGAPGSALDSVTRARATGLAESVLGEVSAVPRMEPPRSGGVITGTVVDHLGQTMADVLVRTNGEPGAKTVRTYGQADIGREWSGPGDIGQSLRERAASSFERDSRERQSRTDEQGRFRLQGLVEGRHRIYAYADGQVFRARDVLTGGSTHLVGREVQLFEFIVELEDGTPVESAIVEVGKARSLRRYQWTAAAPTLRLNSSADSFRFLSGHVVQPKRGAVFADLTSERRRVDLSFDGPGPHLFVVEPTRSLMVTVVDTAVDSPRPEPTVAYALASKVREAGGRASFSRVAKAIRSDDDGAFRLMDVTPGDYVLGVGRGGGTPIVFRDITVGDGPIRETVELPALDRSRYVVVEVRGPDGEPLPGAGFTRWSWVNDKHGAGKFVATEHRPGEYWLPKRPLRDRDGGGPRLVTTVSGWGSVIQPFPVDASQLSVSFQRPCDLTVQVSGPTDLAFEVRANRVATLPDGSVRPLYGQKSQLTDREGEIHMRGIQPGRAQVIVEAGRPRAQPEGSSEVVVREFAFLHSGHQRITVVPESLFELEVHAPGENPGLDLRLSSLEDGKTSRHRHWGPSAELDGSRRAIFQNLKAGTYELRSEWSVPPVLVTVPSGAVRYERPQLFGYELFPETPETALTPFLPDDIVIAVDGVAATTGSFNSRLSLALAAPPVEITVLRDGREQTIELKTWVKDVAYMPVARPAGR